MRDMEQGQETTGVNNGDGVSSATMDEDGDEEKEDKRICDDESNEEDEVEDSYYKMGNKSRTSSEDSSEYRDVEETCKPIVVQETHKIQVKFDTKTLGMNVAKGNNKVWVTKVNTEQLKKKIQINDIISVINGVQVGDDLSAL